MPRRDTFLDAATRANDEAEERSATAATRLEGLLEGLGASLEQTVAVTARLDDRIVRLERLAEEVRATRSSLEGAVRRDEEARAISPPSSERPAVKTRRGAIGSHRARIALPWATVAVLLALVAGMAWRPTWLLRADDREALELGRRLRASIAVAGESAGVASPGEVRQRLVEALCPATAPTG